MSNYLKNLGNAWQNWASRVDGMIHPEVMSDPIAGPLHKSFLLGCFFSGALALLVLPLHLALAGAPHSSVVLALVWMLSQWPLAMYLSRSGNLDLTLVISAGLFAVVTAAICALTGGADSFAVVWLTIPCLEAAFAFRRKTSVIVCGMCGVLYMGLAFFPIPLGAEMSLPGSVEPIVALSAILYAGLIVCRLVGDRQRSRVLLQTAGSDYQAFNQILSSVICESRVDGDMRLLGGPARRLFGAGFADGTQDWIFSRLHVTDRPLYLTRLSEARYNSLSSEIEVRVRRCPAEDEDQDALHYCLMTVRMAPTGAVVALDDEETVGKNVLIALDPMNVVQNAGEVTESADIEELASEPRLHPQAEAWPQETLMRSA